MGSHERDRGVAVNEHTGSPITRNRTIETVPFASLMHPRNLTSDRRTVPKIEGTEFSGFISSMYTPPCNLILTTPAAHVPVQAEQQPLETVERHRTRTEPDVCDNIQVSIKSDVCGESSHTTMPCSS
jgi:hypothetical protein